MDQAWFEMADVRKRKLANAVWIPLRANQQIHKSGEFGHLGYIEEFYGVGTLAVPLSQKAIGEKLSWTDVGISHGHAGYVQSGRYIPADTYQDYGDELSGIHLVLDQRGNRAENSQWHLHQDFVVTMGLKREGDKWVRPDEGYIEVARISKRDDGSPAVLEVRASHFRDYLCARGMALYVTTYRQRVEVVDNADRISWKENPMTEAKDRDEWEGRISEIHEGGEAYGAEWAVLHSGRTDVDPEEDVPVFGLPTGDNIESKTWTTKNPRRKLTRIDGELWRTEWIEPASESPIVRRDESPPTVFFITDAEGKRENRKTLVQGSRWLWFRPEVVCALLAVRGGSLGWYTRNTGNVGCSPDYGRHFGINSLGLVNVYAKDIGMLPEWQQTIWAGYNISPEGKVSEELLASQMRAMPADTLAPEAFLVDALSKLNKVGKAKLGIIILRDHEDQLEWVARCHRFRATDLDGLFALAKDVARLTADSIDAKGLQKIAAPPKDTKWGSLKSLENMIATKIDPAIARQITGPLFGIYDLRLSDAHPASSDIKDALILAGVDASTPYVMQGLQMLHSCVSSLYSISKVIDKNWP